MFARPMRVLVHGCLECLYQIQVAFQEGNALPELCVTTPLASSSLLNRDRAWKAPRTLNAPIRWKFSHLKKNLILGCAGIWPSKGVPRRASGVCGVDARVERVVDVRTGVR